MLVTVVLTFSLVLQIAAAYFALRLINITGRRVAWSLIAAAIVFMAARRGISLYEILTDEHARQPMLSVELIALLISLLMAVGIERIRPIFEDLRENESRYRALFEGAPDAIFIADLETGRIADANPKASLMTQRPHQELVGLHQSALHPPALAEQTAQSFRKHTEEARAGRISGPFEHTLLRADGVEVPVEIMTQQVMLNGRPMIQGVFRDISERRRAQEIINETYRRLTRFLANIDGFLYTFRADPQGHFSFPYASPGIERIYGLNPEDVAEDMTALHQLAHPDDRPRIEATLAESARGMTPHQVEFRVRRPGQPERWILAHSNPEPDKDGGTLWHGIMLDITDRKQAEAALHRYKDSLEEIIQQRTAELLIARDAAEAANSAKSLFLANMSHELRTPLNAILGFSELMSRDDSLPDKDRGNLDVIRRSGVHLLTLINDVLEMAKIEAGRLQLEIAPFDLAGMLRDVIDMMQLRAHEKGLQLLLDQSSEFPRYIKGDEARLRQVLINLIGNAVKFTVEGGITVRLGVRHNSHSLLRIEIEDTGPGIAPQELEHLFEAFAQFRESDTQRGTGLGLAITRQFVQLMHGDISVESELGKGSLFRVEVALEPASAEDVLQPDQPSNGEVIGMAPGQPAWRILICEDQRENQILLTRLMSDIGLESRIAENGEICVRLFQEWQPDLIWMDRRMPVMDGEEATRRIRALPGGEQVRIVAVTASAFKEEQQQLLDAGMDEFVRKPYRFNEIYDSLARQLGVTYLYRDRRDEAAADQPEVTAAALASLPVELRQSLREALQSLDDRSIHTVIERIGKLDKPLARDLARQTEFFDYQALLDTLAELDH